MGFWEQIIHLVTLHTDILAFESLKIEKWDTLLRVVTCLQGLMTRRDEKLFTLVVFSAARSSDMFIQSKMWFDIRRVNYAQMEGVRCSSTFKFDNVSNRKPNKTVVNDPKG